MKIISKLNIKIDVEKARKYYAEVEKNFQHRMWIVKTDLATIKGWSIHGVTGKPGLWPLMEKDMEPPGIENYFETELAFGWAKDMIELFPFGYRAGIGESSPGTVIPSHIDPNVEHMVRLQVPIYTNEECIWTTADGDLNLEVGSAYIVDTAYMHGTRNFGQTPRVHFAMCIPRENLEYVMSLS
jgi:hypothetical protein